MGLGGETNGIDDGSGAETIFFGMMRRAWNMLVVGGCDVFLTTGIATGANIDPCFVAIATGTGGIRAEVDAVGKRGTRAEVGIDEAAGADGNFADGAEDEKGGGTDGTRAVEAAGTDEAGLDENGTRVDDAAGADGIFADGAGTEAGPGVGTDGIRVVGAAGAEEAGLGKDGTRGTCAVKAAGTDEADMDKDGHRDVSDDAEDAAKEDASGGGDAAAAAVVAAAAG